MNSIQLMGYIIGDIELKTYDKNKEKGEVGYIAKYTIGVRRNVKDKERQNIDFINCVAFGKNAEFVSKYFAKKDKILIIGKLRINMFEKDGQKKSATEVEVQEQHFVESKKANDTKEENTKTVDEVTKDEIIQGINDEDFPF